MKILLCILSVLAFFTSLKQQQDNKKIFEKLYALQGTWKMETSKGILYEAGKKSMILYYKEVVIK